MSVVETSYGRLRGAQTDGVVVFKGIPFAKPPVGDLRWRAPEAPEAWPGILDAQAFGPCAIQSTIPGDVGELIGIATGDTSEDCLYLNVWTPGLDDGKRPVMVWIHGGGNTVGAGSQPRVNGEHLARIGDVVVVTVNYRLGALGFLHAPALGATGNEALLDQVAALRWVRAEVATFGGDPNNVTVFGQSAGGFDIAQLMAMPAADGCFDKAVPMSGSLTEQVTASAGEETAVALAHELTGGSFDRLRDVPATEILACQSRIPGARWAPTRDGVVLPEDARKVLGEGRFTSGMPLLIGHTRDESTLFTVFNERFANMDRDALVALARDPFGERAERAIACYESDRREAGLRVEPLDVWAAISTDRMFRLPAIRTAECHVQHTPSVWMYRFDRESPARDGRLGACHSLDIPFVWGTHELPAMRRFCGRDEGVARLSTRVMASYLAFARHGDPNNELVPEWPTYDPARRTTMLLDDEIEQADAPLDGIRAFCEGETE